MSEMTNLFKVQDVIYTTEIFENFNEIKNKKSETHDIFNILDFQNTEVSYRPQGVFKLKLKSHDETVFF